MLFFEMNLMQIGWNTLRSLVYGFAHLSILLYLCHQTYVYTQVWVVLFHSEHMRVHICLHEISLGSAIIGLHGPLTLGATRKV